MVVRRPLEIQIVAVAQTIDGSITAAADGDGSIVINNDSAGDGSAAAAVTITGDVGSSTAAIGSITQTAGNLSVDGNLSAGTYGQTAGTLTVKGNMDVTDFAHTDGDITFNGTSAQTITVVDNDSSDDDGTAGLVSTKGNMSVENAAGVTFTTAVTLTEGNVGIGTAGASVATFSDALTLTKVT